MVFLRPKPFCASRSFSIPLIEQSAKIKRGKGKVDGRKKKRNGLCTEIVKKKKKQMGGSQKGDTYMLI